MMKMKVIFFLGFMFLCTLLFAARDEARNNAVALRSR